MFLRLFAYFAVIAMGVAVGTTTAGAFMVLYTMAENWLRYSGA